MAGQSHTAVDDRDRLGRRQGGAGRLQAHGLAVFGLAAPQLAEDLHHTAHFLQRRCLGGQLQRTALFAHALGDDLHLLVLRSRNRQHHGVETTFQSAGEFIHALVTVVGRGDDRKARHGLEFHAQLGHGQGLFRQHGDQGVLHIGGNARQLFDARDLAQLHGVDQRAGNQRLFRRAMGQQLGIVPAIAQLLFAGAGRALDQHGGVAADSRRQMLGHPGLGRTRHAIQQQCTVGGQRGDGNLHQARIADVLGADLKAIAQAAAHQVLQHRPGRELPVRRTRPVVHLLQGIEFFGKLLFGVLTQDLAHGVLPV